MCYAKERALEDKKMRESFMLKCTVCGEENYLASKNRRTKPEKMELNKFCSRCNKPTVHKERK